MTDSDGICPWELLGVSPQDDRATIRRAWRALVRQYHPDLAGTDREAANRKLAEINAAYDIVWDSDAGRRKLEEDRREAARRKAEAARQAEAERRAEAARKADAEKRAQAAQDARRKRAAAQMPAPRSAGWSRADRLAARAARLAFDRARRVLEGAPGPLRPAVYL